MQRATYLVGVRVPYARGRNNLTIFIDVTAIQRQHYLATVHLDQCKKREYRTRSK